MTYGVEDIARATGIPARTLQRWHAKGWLRASATTGGGKHHRYTEDDLVRARVMAALRDQGLRDIAAASRYARSVIETLMAQGY